MPVGLSKAVNAWKEVTSNADQSLSLVLAGNADLVAAAQRKFSTGNTVPATWVGPLAEIDKVAPASDEMLLIFVLAEEEQEVVDALQSDPPKGGVVLAVKQPKTGGRMTYPWTGCIRIDFADDLAGWREVFSACAELAGDRVVGLGRRYPALRAAACQKIIYRTAGQNAVIGLVFFVPGTDLPAMTLNQLKMVLYVSAIHGFDIGVDRAIEILGIVAAGFGFRGIARKVAAQVPGFGWVYKAIIGYTGTLVVGYAAVKYFEYGAPASTDKAVSLVGKLRR